MATRFETEWLIEFRLPEGTCWAEEWQVGNDTRLGITADKTAATRFKTATEAGKHAVTYEGRLFANAFVVPYKENE